MSFQLRQKLLDRCRAEIGIREGSQSNSGPQIIWYQAATDHAKSKRTGWPWCAAFVCRMVWEWLKAEPDVRAAIGIKYEAIDAFRPRTAGAWDFKNWVGRANKALKARGSTHRVQLLPESAVLHAGDIIVFDKSHIGIVENDHADVVWTIEGNTDATGGRDGDGVYRRKRARSEAQCFVRILG